jgi:hypothetical protein
LVFFLFIFIDFGNYNLKKEIINECTKTVPKNLYRLIPIALIQICGGDSYEL